MNFPASPSVNDEYTFGGRTWKWTGVAWRQITIELLADQIASDVLAAEAAQTAAEVAAADATATAAGVAALGGSAKAWVNFNGTGTVAIRAAFNVSSITDHGTGEYTINFTTAMPDANYVIVSGMDVISGVGWSLPAIHHTTKPTAAGFRTYIPAQLNGTSTLADFPYIMFTVFR